MSSSFLLTMRFFCARVEAKEVNTLEERIKELRKALGLTQTEFAERIGSAQNTITGYETGRRAPSSQVLTLIARTFDVNETWLRTGEGEMFHEVTHDERVAEFVGEALNGKSDSIKRRMISVLSRMNDDDWSAVGHFAELLLEERGDKKED